MMVVEQACPFSNGSGLYPVRYLELAQNAGHMDAGGFGADEQFGADLGVAAPSGDQPVHSFTTLLADLGTICLNQIQPADPALPAFSLITAPTPLQRQTLDLLGVSHRLGIA